MYRLWIYSTHYTLKSPTRLRRNSVLKREYCHGLRRNGTGLRGVTGLRGGMGLLGDTGYLHVGSLRMVLVVVVGILVVRVIGGCCIGGRGIG